VGRGSGSAVLAGWLMMLFISFLVVPKECLLVDEVWFASSDASWSSVTKGHDAYMFLHLGHAASDSAHHSGRELFQRLWLFWRLLPFKRVWLRVP
jgi:hypothetical protein